MSILRLIVAFLKVLLGSRAALAAENLALRHQLAELQRSVKRPKLCKSDRILWPWLLRLWTGWRFALLIVQPILWSDGNASGGGWMTAVSTRWLVARKHDGADGHVCHIRGRENARLVPTPTTASRNQGTEGLDRYGAS